MTEEYIVIVTDEEDENTVPTEGVRGWREEEGWG